ncbi:hypothetical protein SDC9_74076 [bioreactor metagenome]|uniref:Type II CBASS E2 protein domain-containing protein n=1 Tax=bioreactor metagenome TaxID=1076179 RepID=A0A644YNA0_9ZZZZ
MKYYTKQHINPIAIALREEKLVKNHYSFIECKIQKGGLYCYGKYQPTDDSKIYHYRIRYMPTSRPFVTVTDPIIEYNDDIHMFPKDNSLCLYHSSDLVWNSSCHLHNTIIPWTHEWFVFYELYLFTGKWLHPFVPHKKEEKYNSK